MSRNLPTESVEASLKRVVRPFFAVELLFDSPNELRFWSGIGDVVLSGETYVGAGELIQVSEIRESSDISANGATLTLSGIPSDLIALAINEPYQGRKCRILFGMLDYDLTLPIFLLHDDGFLLHDDGRIDLSRRTPATQFSLFTGTMDQMNIVEGPETATISLSVESKLIDLERPRARRYTHNNQLARFPGDLAFEFVNRIQDEELTWGT